ncbi:type IX secretion system plug protein [Amniculibacterium aquaticum]|uniref:type IX secretion system plug protein n=1 Tax=Amniculibacterium aquaticum TaxID=2479858 RepID=UPI000F59F26A|nr:DUF5103 domain-containing protein [Amniculibacterium aquaticum]
MKITILSLFLSFFCLAQDIRSVQLFNPKTNDETPIIGFSDQLILNFDDLSNSSEIYRYTLKHYDRNWKEDGLFFSEFATGSLSGLIDDRQYSFNTFQKYTHYRMTFPNDKIQPKISGNFEIIVYTDSPENPLFSKRFCIVEDGAQLGINLSRLSDARNPNLNQRIEVQAISKSQSLLSNVNSISLNMIQNNNWNLGIYNLKPSTVMGSQLLFQQMNLAFPGNNEFYYFDNKNIDRPFDMVSGVENKDGENYTYLHPVWAFPNNYQYQPDVNGAFYFRRSDLGIERNADNEADYSWVHFVLDSEKTDKEIFVLGLFNDYTADEKSQMQYDNSAKKYIAKIYLKQGFYNYILATKDSNGILNYGEVNGNFWQTENLYQGLLYYTPFGKSYDALIGYGELRKQIR